MANASSYASFGAVTGILAGTPVTVVVFIQAKNANAAIRYLQFFDRNTALAGSEVPVASFALPVHATAPATDWWNFPLGDDWGVIGYTGLVWGFSTAEGSYTAATAADHSVCFSYKPF